MDDADKEEDIHIPTFVEEDVDNYVEQVGKQVTSVHEQVCKISECWCYRVFREKRHFRVLLHGSGTICRLPCVPQTASVLSRSN